MEADKWTIDKLGTSNWITWKFQMRHYLLSKGLWKYVDGTERLADDATDAVRRTFRENTQKALLTIVMAISTPQLYLVTSCGLFGTRFEAILNVIRLPTSCS